jgi:tetratricopeptide (TPR) repeat protein
MSLCSIVPRLNHPLASLFAFVVTLMPVAPLAAQSRTQCGQPDCQLTIDDAWATVAQTNQRKQAFVGALRQLTVALAGTFGDEGARVHSSIESMNVSLDEWDRSISEFETRVRQADRPAEFHVALGAVYLDRNRLEEARREFVEASRLDPQRADAHTFQALSSALLNEPAAAAQALAKASSLEPGKPALVYSEARQLELAAQPEQAGKVLRTFIESQPIQSIDRSASEARGTPFERVALLRQAAGVAPIFPPSLYADAFKLLIQGTYREAVDRLKQLAVRDPLNDGWSEGDRLAQGSAALRNGHVQSALAHLKAAVKSAPNRAEAHRILAMAYRENDQRDESIEELKTAIQLNPSDERARISLADAFNAAGQDGDAERVLRDAIESFPGAGQPHYNLGRLYRVMARNLDAVGSFERAAALNPLVGLDNLYEMIGAIHVVEANFDSAIDALRKRVDVSPNNAEAHRKLGEVYLQQNRSDEALAELLVALLVDPRSAQTYAGIGQLQLQKGKYGEAAEASRRAVELDPEHRGARYSLGSALLRLGRTAEGQKEILEFERLQAEARTREEREWELRLIRQAASVSLDKGDYEQVAEQLRKVIPLSPDDATAYVSLGAVLKKLGRHPEAVENFHKALDLKAGVDVHRLLAESYEALGRLEDSQRHREIYTRAKEERLRALGGSQ